MASNYHTAGKEPLSSEGLGVPRCIRRFTRIDLGATAVVLLAFIVASITVLYKPTAVSLSQKINSLLSG